MSSTDAAFTSDVRAGATARSGPRAGFWARFAAALLDGILLGVINAVVAAILGSGGAYVISLVVSIAYFTSLEGGARGQTLGKRVLNIRVYDLANGGSIGYGRAFVRWIGRIVSAAVVLLGYLWMLWDGEKQTWHDKMAGSVVVPTRDYPV